MRNSVTNISFSIWLDKTMILMKGQATESGKDQVLIQELGQVTIIETNISKILCYVTNDSLYCMRYGIIWFQYAQETVTARIMQTWVGCIPSSASMVTVVSYIVRYMATKYNPFFNGRNSKCSKYSITDHLQDVRTMVVWMGFTTVIMVPGDVMHMSHVNLRNLL